MAGAKHKPAGGQRRRGAKSVADAEVQAEPALKAEFDSVEGVLVSETPMALADKVIELAAVQSSSLMLPDCLDSAAATTVKEMLLAERGKNIVVDASQVRRVGVQSLQVLVSAARTWQHDGQSYRLENPSPEFLETVALVGLKREDILLEGTQQ